MRRGLSLLEVLVAASILAIGLLVALETIGRSARAAQEVEDRTRALLFARAKLEEILKEPVLQTGTDQGEGVDTSTDYDWQATIEPSEHPSLVLITIAARNRKTNTLVTVSTLRRPDLQTPPETTDTSGTGSDTADQDDGVDL